MFKNVPQYNRISTFWSRNSLSRTTSL